MIDKELFCQIGLNADQISILEDALNKEKRYRQILLLEGVSPRVVESIIRTTKLEEIDLDNEDLLREKVKVEWSDMIVKSRVSKVTL